MRAGRQDSLERRADRLGHALAGQVISGDKQFEPLQPQVLEAETCDEQHGRGSNALACLACPHPVADIRRPARAYPVQTDPTAVALLGCAVLLYPDLLGILSGAPSVPASMSGM